MKTPYNENGPNDLRKQRGASRRREREEARDAKQAVSGGGRQ